LSRPLIAPENAAAFFPLMESFFALITATREQRESFDLLLPIKCAARLPEIDKFSHFLRTLRAALLKCKSIDFCGKYGKKSRRQALVQFISQKLVLDRFLKPGKEPVLKQRIEKESFSTIVLLFKTTVFNFLNFKDGAEIKICLIFQKDGKIAEKY